MAINYDHLMSLKSVGQEFQYGDRETMLYALGIGFGRAPMDTSMSATSRPFPPCRASSHGARGR